MDTDRPALGRMGSLEVRLAANEAERFAAQRLRGRIFLADRSENAENPCLLDQDLYDPFCDHLIILDHSTCGRNGIPPIVATCRLLGMEKLAETGTFYSESEFTISTLLAAHPDLRFLEFGRSCVEPVYRNKRTAELLWHGSWAYVRAGGYQVMFGCASFPGTVTKAHQEALAFLSATAGLDENWPVRAQDGKGISMDTLPHSLIDPKRALRNMPPLIKGYLRLGAKFAREAVIDHDFGTTDILVVLPIANLNPRYINYYGEDADRYNKVGN
jgi:putative hemolysin